MNVTIDKAQEQLFAAGKSSRAKYAELVIGRPGLGALLQYELIVTIAQPRAGALGLALRRAPQPRRVRREAGHPFPSIGPRTNSSRRARRAASSMRRS